LAPGWQRSLSSLLVALRAVKRLVKRGSGEKGFLPATGNPTIFLGGDGIETGKKNKRGKNARSILPYAHF